MSIFQGSSRIKISGGTFNAIARDQINHFNDTAVPDAAFTYVGRDQIHNYVASEQQILKRLMPAEMNASDRPQCLPRTRTQVLSSIAEWASHPSTEHRVFWLHGVAGSGKSTISTTIAHHFRELGQLGSFVFFNRDVGERSQPQNVIRTLAYQLGTFDTRIGASIVKAMENIPSIAQSPLRFQFTKLLIEPLSLLSAENARDANKSLLLVLDALDECGSPQERTSLLAILAEESVRLPPFIHILVTSRTESDIESAFNAHPHILAQALDLSSESDLVLYLSSRMSTIRARNSNLPLSSDWPGERVILDLVQRASGLFVWAFIACRYIEDGHDPRERLDVLLHAETEESDAALDALYITALKSAGKWRDPIFRSDFQIILGAILVARNPLSDDAIDKLFCLDRPSRHTITCLGCVLHWREHESVRVLHPSFAEFLMTWLRCRNDAWFIDMALHNRRLALQCLLRLDVVLKRNICDLLLSRAVVDATLPEDISYACTFWIDHVCAISTDVESIATILDQFLFVHLLHWIEAMSILHISRSMIALMPRILEWVRTYLPDKRRLCELIGDTSRVARTFAHVIEKHPLLVYLGALPFAPVNSELYRHFSRADLPRVIGGYEQSWSSLSHVLSAGTEFVWAVAFSPNGKQIASTWMDKTIHVWDLMSGSEVLPPMRCGADFAHLVAFSPNGQRIVCGAGNDLYEWDALSGAQVLGPLLGHEGVVSSVVFSPDGTRIASGSEDGTIRVWNAASGYEMFRLLRKNMGTIHSVVFSSDGQHIISGAADRMVRMWGANQAADAILVLQGHERDVMAVASSPDGNWIVSGSLDGTVRIWDTILGVQILSWPLGDLTINDAMAFSSDGSQFICANSDRIVRVWDIGLWDAKSGSGENAAFFQIPTTPLSIALSPDGMQFATAAMASGVLVYDMTVGMQNGSPQPAHRNVSRAVAVSPDGSRVICGSQNSIRSWAVVSGDEISPMLIGHRGSISALAFSPNGRQIVSSSDDETIRLWVAASGEESFAWSMSRSAESDKSSISSLAFSHQGTQIVSCSDKIHVWDVSTGSLRHCFDEFASWACFSLDGTSIISRESLAFNVRVTDSQSRAVISSNECFLEPCCNINNSIVLDEDGWIVDKATIAVIGKLPNIVSVEGWAASRNIVAFTTLSSNLYIMHFPSCTLISPGTYG